MPPKIIKVLRSRAVAILIHLGLWVLLYLAVVHLNGRAPAYRDAGPISPPPHAVAPVAKLDAVFASVAYSGPVTNAATPSPFFTRFFIPPPTPAPPPPPTTRKVEVTYQGFYETGDGPRFAVLKVAEGLMVAPMGSLVITNVYVAQVSMTNVILTNTVARTNILPLNTKTEIEVPIK